MLQEVITKFREESLKLVPTFKYEDQILTNAQPNNKHFSVIIESDPYITFNQDYSGVIQLNMDVLASGENELSIQNKAIIYGMEIIDKTFSNNRDLLSLISYDILCFTKYTDDECAGCRFTIKLAVPYQWCIDQQPS